MSDALTYTNSFSEMLAPLLTFIRSTGFFEAYIFMPLMTLAAVYLFFRLHFILKTNGTFVEPNRHKFSKTLLFVYFILCFIATNSAAVGFKTMIFEEIDYDIFFWYVPWLSPLHFYITSVASAMLWVIWRNRSKWSDKAACLYVQLGLLGGYYVSLDRILNEPFDLLDPTSGISGIILILLFGVLNWDVGIRIFNPRV